MSNKEMVGTFLITVPRTGQESNLWCWCCLWWNYSFL